MLYCLVLRHVLSYPSGFSSRRIRAAVSTADKGVPGLAESICTAAGADRRCHRCWKRSQGQYLFEGISLLSGHTNPSKWHAREHSYIQHPYSWEMSISLICWVHLKRETIKNGHNHSVYRGLSSTWTWKLCSWSDMPKQAILQFGTESQGFSHLLPRCEGVLKVNGGLWLSQRHTLHQPIFTWMFLTEKCKLHSNLNVMQTTVNLPRLKMLSL